MRKKNNCAFVSAGVLRPGAPLSCYRLFPVAKSESVASLVYDLSDLTPRLSAGPCSLPSINKALELSSQGYVFAIKINLRDRFYHISLCPSTQCHFGVLYSGQTYLVTRLPMRYNHAPDEMQYFSCVTVTLLEKRSLVSGALCI